MSDLMRNFVIDHSGKYVVILGDKTWPIIGWVRDGIQIRPVVINSRKQPEIVHAGHDAWRGYELL